MHVGVAAARQAKGQQRAFLVGAGALSSRVRCMVCRDARWKHVSASSTAEGLPRLPACLSGAFLPLVKVNPLPTPLFPPPVQDVVPLDERPEMAMMMASDDSASELQRPAAL